MYFNEGDVGLRVVNMPGQTGWPSNFPGQALGAQKSLSNPINNGSYRAYLFIYLNGEQVLHWHDVPSCHDDPLTKDELEDMDVSLNF